VTRIEIRVLKGIKRFEMRSHVKNGFSYSMSPLYTFVSKNVCFCFQGFSHEFDCWVETVCLLKKVEKREARGYIT